MASNSENISVGDSAEDNCDAERQPMNTSGNNRRTSPFSPAADAKSTEPKAAHQSFQDILGAFRMTQEQQKRTMHIIGVALHRNTRQQGFNNSPLRWCYVPRLPTGKVSGRCLAMDFGCSDHFFRVSLFNVHSDLSASLQPMDHRVFLLPPTIRRAEMNLFSDYVTQCLKWMLLDNKQITNAEVPIYMGIAAGFEVAVKAQRYPASATVLFSSKDYRMPGLIGQDFVAHFHDAFRRAGININIGTVIKDSVGILLSGIHQVSLGPEPSTDCSIGVLCHRGGANMAYLETDKDFVDFCRSDELNALRRPQGGGYCAVANSEAGYWIGVNGELDCLATAVEKHIHETLNAPLRLECIISGVWYPHVLNQTICMLRATNTINIAAWPSGTLDKTQCFEIFALCDQWCSNKSLSDSELTSKLKDLLAAKSLTFLEARAIVEVCNAIVGRTADWIALTVMAFGRKIYGRIFPRKVAIAYGGSLFTTVSQLRFLLESALNSLVPGGTQVLLVYSDVSFGCAVTAISSGLDTGQHSEYPK